MSLVCTVVDRQRLGRRGKGKPLQKNERPQHRLHKLASAIAAWNAAHASTCARPSLGLHDCLSGSTTVRRSFWCRGRARASTCAVQPQLIVLISKQVCSVRRLTVFSQVLLLRCIAYVARTKRDALKRVQVSKRTGQPPPQPQPNPTPTQPNL